MSTLSVSNITSPNSTIDLTISSGNAAAGSLLIPSNGAGISISFSGQAALLANSSAVTLGANTLVANSTTVSLGPNTLFSNSSYITIGIGNTLISNSTSLVVGFSGTNTLVSNSTSIFIGAGGTNVIVANSTSIVIGANAFIANSSYNSGSYVNVQTFTTSGTWTKPPAGKFAEIWVWGGGASGSGLIYTYGSLNIGGGGGGACNIVRLPMTSLPATVPVTVGLGGVGMSFATLVALSGSYQYANSVSGGTSTFGTYVYAYGGGSSNSYYGIGSPGGGISSSGSSKSVVSYGINGGSPDGGYYPNTTFGKIDSTYGGGAGGFSSPSNCEKYFANGNPIYFCGGSSVFGGGGGSTGGLAGNSVYGGGGGSGIYGYYSTLYTQYNPSNVVGTSIYGGNGGFMSQNGTFPGGGGGAGGSGIGSSSPWSGTGAIGSGANGQVIVYVY